MTEVIWTEWECPEWNRRRPFSSWKLIKGKKLKEAAVAQEVGGPLTTGLTGLSICQSVLGQNIEPQLIAPSAHTSTMHGSSTPLVWEWINQIVALFGIWIKILKGCLQIIQVNTQTHTVFVCWWSAGLCSYVCLEIWNTNTTPEHIFGHMEDDDFYSSTSNVCFASHISLTVPCTNWL